MKEYVEFMGKSFATKQNKSGGKIRYIGRWSHSACRESMTASTI